MNINSYFFTVKNIFSLSVFSSVKIQFSRRTNSLCFAEDSLTFSSVSSFVSLSWWFQAKKALPVTQTQLNRGLTHPKQHITETTSRSETATCFLKLKQNYSLERKYYRNISQTSQYWKDFSKSSCVEGKVCSTLIEILPHPCYSPLKRLWRADQLVMTLRKRKRKKEVFNQHLRNFFFSSFFWGTWEIS